jgi:hypothetical protein
VLATLAHFEWGMRPMKRFLLLPAICVICCAATVAEEPAKPAQDLRRDVSPGSVAPTPEMWFYEQERNRYADPKAAVRRNAEFRAAQRSHRLASSQWYGISNSRPSVSVTPWFGTYSPTWTSNTADPYRWRPIGQTTIVVTPGRTY